jgi:hypothetical protein
MNHPKTGLCPTVGKLSTVIDVIVTVVHPNTCIRSKCWSNGVLGVFLFSKHVFVIYIYIYRAAGYDYTRGILGYNNGTSSEI